MDTWNSLLFWTPWFWCVFASFRPFGDCSKKHSFVFCLFHLCNFRSFFWPIPDFGVFAKIERHGLHQKNFRFWFVISKKKFFDIKSIQSNCPFFRSYFIRSFGLQLTLWLHLGRCALHDHYHHYNGWFWRSTPTDRCVKNFHYFYDSYQYQYLRIFGKCCIWILIKYYLDGSTENN